MLLLISRFNDVHWTLSIDAVEDAGEYIRYGSKWATIEKNVHNILKLKHSVSINATISAYSILTLSKLLVWFKNLKDNYINQPLEIMFHAVTHPVYLHPQILSGLLKFQALDELGKSIDILKDITSNPDRELDNLKNLQNILTVAPDHKNLNKKFNDFTELLDNIRNQNFNKTFILEKL